MLLRTLAFCFVFLLCGSHKCNASIHGAGIFTPPTPDIRCVISGTVNGVSAGDCTGIGGGSSLFTAATCNGTADDRAAFISFNNFINNVWQAAHTGLVELDIQSGKNCNLIAGTVNNNTVSFGIKKFQLVGYGAIMGNGVGGGGFFLGSVASAISFDNAHSARVATVTAGSSSITLVSAALCSLFHNGDAALIGGIDPQGFGDPPNPQIFEWVFVQSTASCAGSGVITLSNPLAHTYKSTWPAYNAGGAFNSDLGGPGTLYVLDQRWMATQAYYGITINQDGFNSNSAGMDITFRDVSWTNTSCNIPSQNLNWRIINGTGVDCVLELDKIVSNIVMDNVSVRRTIAQQPALTSWTCNRCTIGPIGVTGTLANTVITNSNLAQIQLGSSSYGAAGAFAASNTVVTQIFTAGASQNQIEKIGVWSSAGLTIPQNLSASAAANNGLGEIRLTVNTTAGWTTGLVGGAPGPCGSGVFPIVVIDGTHLDMQGSVFTANCSGPFGNLPMTWAVPGANIQFDGGGGTAPTGPILQVADLANGANNSTVISFSQNGSPWTGGLPTMLGSTFTVTTHPAPSFICTNCTGNSTVTDVSNLPTGPYGSQARRVVTAANSGPPALPAYGPLHELDVTVTSPCGAASNIDLSQFVITQFSAAAVRTFTATVNATIANPTARIVTPTTTSGAQSGDNLVPPGVNTLVSNQQLIPSYTSVGNCGTASTTVTQKTDQGVVNFLLKRDIDPASNDNDPMWLEKAG